MTTSVTSLLKKNSKNCITLNFLQSLVVGESSCVNMQRTFAPIILRPLFARLHIQTKFDFCFRWGDCPGVHKAERGPGGNGP